MPAEAMTAEERRFVGCWLVREPLLDGPPWRVELDSMVTGRNVGRRPFRAMRADPRIDARYHANAWGQLYPVDSVTYQLSFGATPAALEFSVVSDDDSLVGTAAWISHEYPYRTPIGPARLFRVPCTT